MNFDHANAIDEAISNTERDMRMTTQLDYMDGVSLDAIHLYDEFQASFEERGYEGYVQPSLLDPGYIIAATVSSDTELDIFDRLRHLTLTLDDELGRLDFLLCYDSETKEIRNFTLLADCTYANIPIKPIKG